MRLDRLITLSLVSPFHHATRRLRTLTLGPSTFGGVLPILMYHSISDDPEPGVRPYYKVCTSPRRFAEHMQWLADWGYRGVTLRAGLAALASDAESGAFRKSHVANEKSAADEPCDLGPSALDASHLDLRPAPSRPHLHPHSQRDKPVALTFDDGIRDFYTEAFPILQQHGFSATMYLPTAFIGDERRTFKGRECLTWSEVADLHQAGIEFGSHTVNHPRLVELPWSEIEPELVGSKVEIERRLGCPIAGFSYPYAFPQTRKHFVARFHDFLRAAAYSSAVTTEIGRVMAGDDPCCLRRLPANDADDALLLTAKLRGDYDWLARPQHVFKTLTRMRRAEPDSAR
jgi:peptidoglycan/xylan/chitin deacetylase (PgdA/CDA1 family)